jgi:predicted RNase H-like HicB family nuclease
MRTVRVQYHREPKGWWAESPDLEGFVASGSTVDEVRHLVHEDVPFYLQEDDVEIKEIGDRGSLVAGPAPQL